MKLTREILKEEDYLVCDICGNEITEEGSLKAGITLYLEQALDHGRQYRWEYPGDLCVDCRDIYMEAAYNQIIRMLKRIK